MKKSIRYLTMVVIIIMSLGILIGCYENLSDDIATDKVNVSIKAEYKEKFLAEGFLIDDFTWDNVERIEYRQWYDNIVPEIGYFMVFLKKHSKKRVQDAKRHFEKLDFVYSVSYDGKAYMQ